MRLSTLSKHLKMTSPERGSLQQKTFSIEWKIERFFTDCTKIGDFYRSPVFPIEYAGATTKWYLRIHPMGEKEKDKNFVSLFLFFRSDTESGVVASYQFSVVSEIKSFSKRIQPKTFKVPMDNWGISNFVEQNILKDAENGALINDTLTILCKITFHPVVQDILAPFHGYDEWLDKIEKDYYEDKSIFGTASNVTFKIQHKQVHLHKAILMGRNSVFRAMFEHKMKEKNESLVKITDANYEVMMELFRFIYSGKVENMEKMAKELLIVADKYTVTELKALCEKTLYDNLTVDNAVECLKLVDMCDTLYLKRLAIKFVVDNVKDIVPKCDFKSLFTKLSRELVCEIMEAVAEKI